MTAFFDLPGSANWRKPVTGSAKVPIGRYGKNFVNRLILVAIVLTTLASSVWSQDWTKSGIGNVEWNCDALAVAIMDFGDEYYLIIDGSAVTVKELFAIRSQNCGIEIDPITGTAFIEFTDDWTQNATGEYFYKCEPVLDMVEAYGDLQIMRGDDNPKTLLRYHQIDVPECVPRHLIVKRHSILFECADRSRDSVQRVLRGEVLEVVGIQEDWYEVATDDGTAFVFNFHVVPGPYDIIQPDEQFALRSGPKCVIVPVISGDEISYVSILRTGPALKDMTVDLYRPLDDTVLRVEKEVENTFTNDNQPYIIQRYHSSIKFPTGIYTIAITLDEATYRVGFNMKHEAANIVHVGCN